MSVLAKDQINTAHPFVFLRRHRVAAHVLFWVWVYLLDVFFFGVGYEDVPRFIVMALLEMPGQLLIAYSTAYWILPRYFRTLKLFEAIVFFTVVFILTGLLSHTLYYFMDVYSPSVKFGSIPKIILVAFYCFLKGCFFILIKLVIEWYDTRKSMAELERDKIQSELKMLKDQVNPHFMFNTLNNLYGLISRNPSHAQESVMGLSGILHYMLYESNHETVPLSKEIKCIKDYIELEKLRYPENLSISFNVQPGVESISILPLSIFPFVENSFKHGTAELIKDAWINIDFSLYRDEFIFKIENGKPPVTNRQNGSGIGLANVKRRLELTYGKDHSLQILDSEDTYLAVLKIALLRMQRSNVAQYENEMSYR